MLLWTALAFDLATGDLAADLGGNAFTNSAKAVLLAVSQHDEHDQHDNAVAVKMAMQNLTPGSRT